MKKITAKCNQLNTYMFFAEAVKYFDRLWLKDCLLELCKLGYDLNTRKILLWTEKRNIYNNQNISNKAQILDTCCTETSTINSIQEEVKYRYGKVNINWNASIYGQHSNSR